MTLLLAGDIGGSKTILRLVKLPSEGSMYSLDEATYKSRDYPDLVPMVGQFLEGAYGHLGYTPQPDKACFAIAGPVIGNTAKLTNLSWSLDSHRLEQELGIAKVSLINDFAAVGYGVSALPESELYTLQAGNYQSTAPLALIGAGTGLGEGFLIPLYDKYIAFASEGGHADFAPRSGLQIELLQYLMEKYNTQHVSVERVVSGQGIVAVYQFLRDRLIASESSDVATVVRNWEQGGSTKEQSIDAAAAISQAALEKRDKLCQQTMQIFVESYGAEAGNLALKLLPYGGLYIAGGIAAKILPLMEEGSFMAAFTEKGRMSTLLERVPVHIILNPQVGIVGAAIHAARI
jgi:glucokinase